MMIEIMMKPDDPRIGKPGFPPAVDIDGNSYTLPILNRMNVGEGAYVVLPIVVSDTYSVLIEAPAKKGKAVEIPDQA